MMEESKVIHEWAKSDPTKKVKLSKMSKGYQWEITYEHTDNDTLLAEIRDLNTKLNSEYNKEGDEVNAH